MRRSLALLLVLAAARAPAEPPVRLEALFPEEADIHVSGAGLARLELPPEVLRACRPDLSDVRVFDAGGREVAFVVDAGAALGAERRETRTVAATVADLTRSETPRERQPAHTREEYRLAAPPDAGPWDLVLETRRSGFVRGARVTGDDGTPLVERAALIRLGDPAVDRLRIALPAIAGQSITVTIEGDEGFFLEPTFRFETARALAGSGQATVPLAATGMPAHPGGRTVLEVERPSGVVPQVLRLATSTPAFDRRIQVWDVRPGASDAMVGDGRVLRVTTADVVEQLDVSLAPARGPRLRVEIADGDSPPLADLAVSAVVRQPTLIFALPGDAAVERAGTLRFGGGRAYRPRYDVAALLPAGGRALAGPDAAVGARLYDPARLAAARLGDPRPNPAFDAAPALAFAMRPGAPVDARAFSYRRALEVPASPDGVARLELAPEDLAHGRPDLADLRVVDGEGRQWPFLLDRDVPPATVELAVAAPERREGRSRFALALPASPLTVAALELDVDLPFFHRRYTLETRDAAGVEHVAAGGAIARDARRPEPVRIAVEPRPVTALTLVVDDGDDAPLPLGRATAEVPRAVLLVAAPAGHYDLLAGAPDAEAPRYELARVRDVVLALHAAPIAAGAAGPNPAYSRTARMAAGDTPRQLVVWAVLVGAVALLGVLTLRAARRP